MKYTELKNDIASTDRRIYLFEGDDAYFRTNGEAQVRRAFLQMEELNFTAFDGSRLKGKAMLELTSAMSACPFMAPKRIVRVSEFYPTEAEYERYLKAAFEGCPQETILIIVNGGAGKGASLKRKKCITYVDCSRAEEEVVTRWAYATLKRAGIASDVAACRNIAAYCLCYMSRVESEVKKLIEYGKSPVTAQDVEALVYKDTDYRIYEMTDAVAAKNYSRFIQIVSGLSLKSTEKTMLVSALQRYFKNLLIILSSSDSMASLASSLSMPEFAVKRSAERARAFGKDKLLYLSGGLYKLSARMRSGELTPEGAFYSALAAVLFG